ncbi:unnamed protein product [Rotaria sp. Silwood2]|nr:unnamed protein product [Rotaria sp. Silwood2]
MARLYLSANRELATYTYSCLYEIFLCNTDIEQTIANLEAKTSSVWSIFNTQSTQFINPSFHGTRKETPAGSSEHPSSSLANRLHRSTADPKLKRSSSSKAFLIKKRNRKDSKLKQQIVY